MIETADKPDARTRANRSRGSREYPCGMLLSRQIATLSEALVRIVPKAFHRFLWNDASMRTMRLVFFSFITARPGESVMTTFGGLTLTNQATPEAAESSCETVQDIINIAVTAEAFAVTLLGEALARSERGDLPMNPELSGTLKAARAAEQAHFDVLTAAGAEPITLEFTVPDPDLLSNVGMFLETLISLEEAFVAAYLAAAQEFSILGEASLAQLALQIGAVEAEHRAGARFFAIQAGNASGTPNDRAFEKALFRSVGEAATMLEELGFIGGDGDTISYPGPGDIDTTGVSNLQP